MHADSQQSGSQKALQFATVLSVIFGIVIILYLLVGVVVNFASKRISDESEARLFAGFSKKIDALKKAEELKQPDFLVAQTLFDQLTSQPGLRKLNYQLTFEDDPIPNAFAFPGGSVSITSGLLKIVPGKTGLAMVLAHELGHHQGRHALRGVGRSIAMSLVVGLIFGSDNTFITSALSLAEASHSRSQEHAADAWGLKLVYSTLGTTDGAYEFFENIVKNPERNDSKFARILSSHPYTPDRISALRVLEGKLKNGVPRRAKPITESLSH